MNLKKNRIYAWIFVRILETIREGIPREKSGDINKEFCIPKGFCEKEELLEQPREDFVKQFLKKLM